MNPQLRDSAAHVFVDDIASPVISDDDRHHLRNVLRVRGDETVSVSDGRGSWRLCTLTGDMLQPVSDVHVERQSRQRVAVALVPVKGERTETSVEKLVEIGVDEIMVLRPTRHAVVRWNDDKAMSNLDRLRRIARSAAMQSRRVFMPVVSGLAAFDDVVGSPHVAVADPAGGSLGGDIHTIVVGPEGGFSDDEIAAAHTLVSLGDHVLRADTAAVVAGVLMVTHFAPVADNTE